MKNPYFRWLRGGRLGEGRLTSHENMKYDALDREAARCSLDAQTLGLETPLHLALRGGHLEAPRPVGRILGWLIFEKTTGGISGSNYDPCFIHVKY